MFIQQSCLIYKSSIPHRAAALAWRKSSRAFTGLTAVFIRHCPLVSVDTIPLGLGSAFFHRKTCPGYFNFSADQFFFGCGNCGCSSGSSRGWSSCSRSCCRTGFSGCACLGNRLRGAGNQKEGKSQSTQQCCQTVGVIFPCRSCRVKNIHGFVPLVK